MALDRLYTDKQVKILKRAVATDWYMMINHGAVRAGKWLENKASGLFDMTDVLDLNNL